MKFFVTSDTHFGHENIIKYCNRPFASLEDMNEIIIKNWNDRICNDDTVLILGDFCFKTSKKLETENGDLITYKHYIERLNGQKVFVKGNHDDKNSVKTIIQNLVIRYEGQQIFCVHKPQDANTEYDINFVGHVHNNWHIKKYKNTILFNVGVDVNGFVPITIVEALNKIDYYLKNSVIEEIDFNFDV